MKRNTTIADSKKVKLFTHTDLDGIGNYIICKLAFNEVDVEFCNYDKINESVTSFINDKEFKEFDHIFITDISVNETTAKLIDETVFTIKNDSLKLKNFINLVDHHKTAEFLNTYDWCSVTISDEKGICSGTSLFYAFIKQHITNNSNFNSAMDEFVELVRRFDTWEWFNIYKDTKANMLNSLFFLYGSDRFAENTINKIKENNFDLNDTDKLLLALEEEKKKFYFEKRLKKLKEIQIDTFKVGAVEAEQYTSELGNYLAIERPDLDFIVIINDGKVSYRGVKDDVDLSEIAKKFGGGGHRKASGSSIDSSKTLKYFNDIFS